MNRRPKLTLMLGNSHSGKSTWVEKNKGDACVVCPDTIRKLIFGHQFHRPAEEHVWALTKSMVTILLHQGKSVILDATNLRYEVRRPYWDIAKEFGARTEIVWVRTPVLQCLKRNRTDKVKAIPPQVVANMDVMLEEPSKEEVDKIRMIWYGKPVRKSRKE